MENNKFTYKSIWLIAFPIILGSLAQDLITITDTAFIGRLGEIALGAVAIGAIFYLAIVMFGWGFGLGIQIIIARRFGENKLPEINRTLFHAFIVLMLGAFALFLFFRLSHFNFINSIVQSQAIAQLAIEFLNIRIFGLFPAFINILFRAFYIGTSNTKIISHTTVFMAIVNISLDYLLIFGVWIFPTMGLKGAALASVIAEFAAMFYFLVHTKSNAQLDKFALFTPTAWDQALFKRIGKVSTPTMLQNIISFSAWFIFFLVVEKMGEAPLAVSNIIRNIYIILLLPIMGFAAATNSLVSYALGLKKQEMVGLVIKRSLALSWLGILLIALISLTIPELVISLFTQSQDLIQQTLPVFYVIVVAAFFLAFGFILFQALSGTGNTQITLVIEIVVIVIYLIGVYIVTNIGSAQIHHVWMMEIFYGSALGLLSLAYLKFGKWNKVTV